MHDTRPHLPASTPAGSPLTFLILLVTPSVTALGTQCQHSLGTHRAPSGSLSEPGSERPEAGGWLVSARFPATPAPWLPRTGLGWSLGPWGWGGDSYIPPTGHPAWPAAPASPPVSYPGRPQPTREALWKSASFPKAGGRKGGREEPCPRPLREGRGSVDTSGSSPSMGV